MQFQSYHAQIIWLYDLEFEFFYLILRYLILSLSLKSNILELDKNQEIVFEHKKLAYDVLGDFFLAIICRYLLLVLDETTLCLLKPSEPIIDFDFGVSLEANLVHND